MRRNVLRKSITATLFFVAFASAFAAKTYISEAKLSTLYTIDGSHVIKTMNHQDLDLYLDSVRIAGVKAIDMCALLNNNDENYYHDKALRNGNLVAPLTTNGSAFADAVQYDYWDNIVYVVRECWKRLRAHIPLSSTDKKQRERWKQRSLSLNSGSIKERKRNGCFRP